MGKPVVHKNMREWAEALTTAVDAEMRNQQPGPKPLKQVKPLRKIIAGSLWSVEEEAEVHARIWGNPEALAVVPDAPNQPDAPKG